MSFQVTEVNSPILIESESNSTMGENAVLKRSKRIVPASYRLLGIMLNFVSRLNNNWTAELLSNLWFRVFKSRPKPWVNEFWQTADRRVLIDVSGTSIPVYLWGKGPLIVTMHGWSGSGTQFRRFIPPLVEAGFQIAVFDAPAHGSNLGKKAHLLDFSDALTQIQNQLGPIDTVIAHSLGAMASVLALQRGLFANRMVLVAGHLDVQQMHESFSQSLSLNKMLKHRFHRRVGEKMAKILGVEDPWQMLNPKSLLHDTDVPGLLVYDHDDEEIPMQQFDAIAHHWNFSQTLQTEGLGHNGILKNHAVIQRVVDYLQRTT